MAGERARAPGVVPDHIKGQQIKRADHTQLPGGSSGIHDAESDATQITILPVACLTTVTTNQAGGQKGGAAASVDGEIFGGGARRPVDHGLPEAGGSGAAGIGAPKQIKRGDGFELIILAIGRTCSGWAVGIQDIDPTEEAQCMADLMGCHPNKIKLTGGDAIGRIEIPGHPVGELNQRIPWSGWIIGNT